MSAVRKASRALGTRLGRAMREGDGSPPEADSRLNRASVAVVHAMAAEHGEAWLGKVNRDKDARAVDVLWQWTEGTSVYNFGADFVLPAYDGELARMLLERENVKTWTAAGDIPRLEAIFERVRALGGEVLVWS